MSVASDPKAAEIARAAARLFGAHGYHGTTVRQVAGAVNLQGGSLYAHYASKEDMLAEVVEAAAAAFHEAVTPELRGSGVVAERLRRALAAHIGVVCADPAAAAVYFQDWRHLTGARLTRAHRERDAYERLWRDLFAEGVATGELRPVDPSLAAIACLSVGNWMFQWYRPDGPLHPDAIAAAFADLLLRGALASTDPPQESPT